MKKKLFLFSILIFASSSYVPTKIIAQEINFQPNNSIFSTERIIIVLLAMYLMVNLKQNADTKNEVEKLEENIKQLKKVVGETEQNSTTAVKNSEQLVTEINNIKKQVSTLNDQITQQIEKANQEENKLEVLSENNKMLDEKITTSITEQTIIITNLNTQLNELKLKLEELRSQKKETDLILTEISNKLSQANNLTEDILSLQNQLCELEIILQQPLLKEDTGELSKKYNNIRRNLNASSPYTSRAYISYPEAIVLATATCYAILGNHLLGNHSRRDIILVPNNNQITSPKVTNGFKN